MKYHPRTLICLLVVLLVSGCTGELPPIPSRQHPEVNAPALPAQVFPALPDRGNGVTTSVDALTGDGSTLVMQATIDGRASVPVLRSSTDGGASWTDGKLTDEAAKATQPGESTEALVGVARTGQERSWLALGRKDDALLAWTSGDATVWSRATVTGIDPRREVVQSLVGLAGGGFVAVGGEWTDTATYPRVWTSANGVSWKKHKVSGEGMLVEVAASGKRLVAVGNRSLTQVTAKGRSGNSLLFSSTDRGGSWRSTRVREPSDSANFTSWLDHVVATANGFIVGGSYFDGEEGTYRPFLRRSSNLRTWTAMPWLPELDESSGIDELLQIGSSTLVVQDAESAGRADRVWVQMLAPGKAGWRLAGVPAADDSVADTVGAVAGDRAVLSVAIDSQPTRTELWTVNLAGDVSRTVVRQAEGAAPAVNPSGLLLVEGRPAAFGTAQGVDVLWRSDGAGWKPPGVVREQAGESIQRMQWSASGGFLATGSQDHNHAFVLHSEDGATWRRTAPGVFNSVAQYHYSSINAVAWAHGRWAVVGDKATNGSTRSGALVYTSTNGRSWSQGKPRKVTARGDWYRRTDPLDDLHGLDNRSRSMLDVLGLPRGWVAVGETTVPDRERPAAWVSVDGRTWRLIPLTSGSYPEAGLWGVTRVGDVVLGVGWARAKNAPGNVRANWRSTDAGRSWSFQAFPGELSGAALSSSDREFVQVALGDDDRTLTLYRSIDGLAWTPSPITINGLGDGMQVTLKDILVDGATLHLLLGLKTRSDAVTVVQTVPL